MKRVKLLLLFSFLTNIVWSQVVFNNIIEDTVTHITSTVIALDSGYIISSGSRDEAMVRCFALTYIDESGQKQWKRTYSDLMNEYWEGYSNNLKFYENSTSLMGSYYNNEENVRGIHFSIFDSLFNIDIREVIYYDSVWKKCYNHIMFDEQSYFLTGQVHDPIDDLTKALLIKTNNIGEISWIKMYGQKYELGAQIIKTSDNSILIGGLTFSFPTTITDEDWYLIKLDTSGNIMWDKGFGKGGFLNYDGAVAGIVEVSDSNYIACGGYPALRSDTDSYWDGCIRKVSKDGELMWEKFYRSYSKISNPETDYIENSVSSVKLINGGLYVVGNWRSRIGRSRGYLQKITEEGEIYWNREYYAIDSTSNNQCLVSFQPTQDNGFILAGYGNDYDTHGYDPPQQAWLVKTDSLGLDGLCYPEIPELNFDIEIPDMICANDTMQVYVNIAGKSAPYTIEFSTGQIIDSIYYPPTFVPVEIGLSLAEIEYGGNIIYSEEITEATLSNHEWGQCIAKPVEFYTPQFYGTHNIDITVTDVYGESKTITKSITVNNCGSFVELENTCPVKLYPNPVKDKVYLDIPNDVNAQNAEFYNSTGQIIKTATIHKGLNIVDVFEFASGSYIVKIIGDKESFSLSFEKE